LVATITSNKLVLQFLDILEEFRDLSLEEWNFRALVHKKLKKLLENQRIYWMQRGGIKWVTLGDENTKFFYANATIRHNKNSIMSLKGEMVRRSSAMKRKPTCYGKLTRRDWELENSHTCILTSVP
jgi:hypothetical protein